MEKKEQFIKAIQDNEGLIYKVASFYTSNKEDRNDLVQDIIYNLWKSFETFNRQASLSTWMYRVAMNVAILHLKTNKRKIRTNPVDLEVLNYPDTTDDTIKDKIQVLQKQVSFLNLFDKGLVLLYLEGKSYDEIAEITGISKSNVGTKLMRIKDKLRQQVSKFNHL